MRHNTRKSLLSIALCAAPVLSAVAEAPIQALPDFKVSAIHAYLYYESTGKMSRDILGTPPFNLWNTIIGDGDAETASDTTMVVVEIACPKKQINVPATRKLKVQLIRGNRPFQTEVLAFPFVEPTGKVFIPVMCRGHNELPVKVTATILGQAHLSTLSKVINFDGGE